MRDSTHKMIEQVSPFLGAAVVLAGVALCDDRTWQLVAAVAGLLITQAGRLQLGRPVYSIDRRFQALRKEVDHFILLVRRLNAAALGVKEMDSPSTRQVVESTQERMRESFDRMALLAGRTDEEISALNLANVEHLSD